MDAEYKQTDDEFDSLVIVKTDPKKMDDLVATEGLSVAQIIWKEVRPTLNKANSVMKKYLTSNLNVKEFYPMMEDFDNSVKPVELLE